jgi:RNA recognition motif-containing protein
MFMKPDQNFAFAIYDSEEQALHVCKLLNGIQFMKGALVVKPRDKTRNVRNF